MKNLLQIWIDALNKPSPDTLDHGPEVPKNYDYPDTVPGEVIRKFTDNLLDLSDKADQYVNDPENWWDREEVEWQASYRDAAMTAVETLRQLINTTTPPLDLNLIETLFPKQAS